MPARFKLNHVGMKELLSSGGVEADMMRRAEAVAGAARASAPVDTGAYQASIRVESVQHPTRVVARVVADSDHALVVEVKTRNLGRSIDAAGG